MIQQQEEEQQLGKKKKKKDNDNNLLVTAIAICRHRPSLVLASESLVAFAPAPSTPLSQGREEEQELLLPPLRACFVGYFSALVVAANPFCRSSPAIIVGLGILLGPTPNHNNTTRTPTSASLLLFAFRSNVLYFKFGTWRVAAYTILGHRHRQVLVLPPSGSIVPTRRAASLPQQQLQFALVWSWKTFLFYLLAYPFGSVFVTFGVLLYLRYLFVSGTSHQQRKQAGYFGFAAHQVFIYFILGIGWLDHCHPWPHLRYPLVPGLLQQQINANASDNKQDNNKLFYFVSEHRFAVPFESAIYFAVPFGFSTVPTWLGRLPSPTTKTLLLSLRFYFICLPLRSCIRTPFVSRTATSRPTRTTQGLRQQQHSHCCLTWINVPILLLVWPAFPFWSGHFRLSTLFWSRPVLLVPTSFGFVSPFVLRLW